MRHTCGLLWVGFLSACASGTPARLDRINDSMVDWGPSEPTAVDPIGELKTLERATYVRAVLGRHPSTRAAREAVLAAVARVSQSRTVPGPMISLGLAPLSIGAGQVPFGGSIELRQRLPNLGQLSYLEEAATLRAEMERDEAEVQRRALAADAASLFDDFELVLAAIRINRAFIELLDTMKLSAESDFAAGRAPASLRTEIEMEALRLLREQIALRAEEQTLIAKLNILLGRPSDTALPPLAVPSKPAPPPRPKTEAELEELALAARPEIRRAARGQLEGATMSSIAGWAPWPEIELMTSYNSMWHDPEHRWMVGLGLSVPINISALRATQEEADALARTAQLQAEAIALEVRAEVVGAHRMLTEIEVALDLYEKRMRPLAEERRELVRASVDVALQDYRSLIEAERTVREVDLEILAMRRELMRRRTDLQLALGQMPGEPNEESNP